MKVYLYANDNKCGMIVCSDFNQEYFSVVERGKTPESAIVKAVSRSLSYKKNVRPMYVGDDTNIYSNNVQQVEKALASSDYIKYCHKGEQILFAKRYEDIDNYFLRSAKSKIDKEITQEAIIEMNKHKGNSK